MNAIKKFRTIFLLILALSVSAATLGACADQTKTLSAVCLVDGEIFTLPFKPTFGWKNGTGCGFGSPKSPEEIASAVNAMEFKNTVPGKVARAEIVGKYVTVEFCDGSDHTHFYVVTLLSEENGKFGYYFAQPSLLERLENGDSGWCIVVPIHCFGQFELDQASASMKEDVAYPVDAEIADFADFYASLGIYDVTTEENRLQATVNGRGIKSRFYSQKSFTIEFERKEEGVFATYRFIG